MTSWSVPEHVGDRVMYDGREWKVTAITGRVQHLAELKATDHSGDVRPEVHRSHLTMSWCPLSHGGSGPPPTIRAAKASPHPCAHDACHEPIDAGERYVRVVKDHAVASMHLECAQIHVGHDIAAVA